MKVVGYMRVSTEGQVYGLEAQHKAIEDEVARRGWEVQYAADEGRSGKDINRPGITRALALLKAGEAEALVVSKLDRLARSLLDLAQILDLAKRQGWAVIVMDIGIDTTTPTGELVVNVMGAVAQWERRMIGVRTKEGLAAAKSKGVRIGRPPLVALSVVERIVAERAGGSTYRAIADALNADQVPTAGAGAKWHPNTVRAVAQRV